MGTREGFKSDFLSCILLEFYQDCDEHSLLFIFSLNFHSLGVFPQSGIRGTQSGVRRSTHGLHRKHKARM